MQSYRNPGSKIATQNVEFSALGVRISISIPSDLAASLMEKSAIFLPIDGDKTPRAVEPIEINVMRGSPGLRVDGKSAVFVSNADDNSIVTDTLIIASRLLEKVLNEHGVFTMHAASVSYDGRAVLLLGPYGGGKTTAAVHLCLKDHTIGYVTGGRVFLDAGSGNVLYGMDTISMRTGSVINEFRAVDADLPRKLGLDPQRIPPSQYVDASRIYFGSSKLGLNRANFPLSVGAIALIRKFEGNFVMFKPEHAGSPEILALHAALCEYSEKGYVMLGPRLHFPDIFTQELKSERLNYAERLAEEVPVVYVEGRLEDVSMALRGLLLRR